MVQVKNDKLAALPFRICAAYGGPALPLALFAITFTVYLPKFYSDTVGVPLSAIGIIIIISRIWDAVSDPIIGTLSDRTQSRWGRRKPWMFVAVLPLSLSFLLLFYPYLFSAFISPTIWLGLLTLIFYLFWTMFSLPYEALGAELSFDFNERTKILGFRDGLLVLGTLFAAVCPFAYEHFFPEASQNEKFLHLGLTYSGLFFVLAALCLLTVSEQNWSTDKLTNTSFFRSISEVLKNKPFRILLIAYTTSAFGAALPATLILYYVEYVLQADEAAANGFLVLYFLVGFLFLPAWVWLSSKIGKKEAWLGAMTINTAAFACVFFLESGDLTMFGVLISISAVGYGATLALPSSMQADVIDYDELETGKRREGQFVGFWSISKKMSAALGAGIAFPIMEFTGYIPNQEQVPETLWVISFLYAGVPCICNAFAIVIAWRYPIDQKMFEEIRSKIDDKKRVN